MKKNLVLKSALALSLASPLLASAESQLVNTGSAVARLDFRVIVPRVLFLGVGAGADAATPGNNADVSTVTFDFTNNPAAVGTGGAAAVISGNVVPVRVIGNNG